MLWNQTLARANCELFNAGHSLWRVYVNYCWSEKLADMSTGMSESIDSLWIHQNNDYSLKEYK